MKKKLSIKEEMDMQLTRKQSDFLWKKATKRLDSILKRYEDLPEGVHLHTDSRIFPSAAIYLTAKEYVPAEKAYSFIENAAIKKTVELEDKLAKMMRIPGMAGLFVRVRGSDPNDQMLLGFIETRRTQNNYRLIKHYYVYVNNCIC